MNWKSAFSLLAQVCSASTNIEYPRQPHGPQYRSCTGLSLPKLQGFKPLSIHAVEVHNLPNPSDPAESGLNFCNLTIALTHLGEDDYVIATIWLPLDNWNGRFVARGGGGLSSEANARDMADHISQGWAVGSTDAGLSLNRTISASSGQWVLRKRQLNWTLITNFAHRSIHDMTTIGKAAVHSFYGRYANYSYYSGCSTGGRQGYFAAQHHPEDFDGILANAPAIHTPRVSPGTFWPSVVMGNIAAPPQCIFQAYFDAILNHCDALDGVKDGLISLPDRCNFNAHELIGKVVNCVDTGSSITITADYATVVAKVLEGAKSSAGDSLWYGTPPGASFAGQANTRTVNGTTVPVPFGSGETWMKYFVAQDPLLDTASLSFKEYETLFQRSVDLYTGILGTTSPDLTSFKDAGGKLLTWHGLADPLLTHEGTKEYWHSLQRSMGNASHLDKFYRVFLAPGVGHCSGGYGPVPVDPLSVLVDWVEKKTEPKTLFAQANVNGRSITRNLCRYPNSLLYKGVGDVNSADSFICSKGCSPRRKNGI